MPVLVAPPDPITASLRPIIFYTAHQDDATLWAGHILAHHALVGRTVIIVCASDGSTSVIRNSLNGTDSNGFWDDWHYPLREQIPYLSPADFAAARDREEVNADLALGALHENIHLETDWRQPTLDVARARELIERYAALYPDAGHYTTHWLDSDPTHAALGAALRQLATDPDPVTRLVDCRWVVRPSQKLTIAHTEQYIVPVTYADKARIMVEHAVLAYKAWAPLQGMYAIGWHSVETYFKAVLAGEPNWIVKTPAA